MQWIQKLLCGLPWSRCLDRCFKNGNKRSIRFASVRSMSNFLLTFNMNDISCGLTSVKVVVQDRLCLQDQVTGTEPQSHRALVSAKVFTS